MLEQITMEALTSLLALTFLEIVLGIDNIVFLAVAVARLPADEQGRARQIGLWMAMVMRIVMLFGLALLTHMEAALFSAFGHDFTIESLVLIAGGLFLLAKGTMEVHHSVEGEHDVNTVVGKASSIGAVLAQIAVITPATITAVPLFDRMSRMFCRRRSSAVAELRSSAYEKY